MAMRPRFLLVGRRQRALAAAARLDAEVLVIDDAPVSPALTRRTLGRFREVDLADTDQVLRAAQMLTADRPPDAVVAVVERAVLPAAEIREALGVAGAKVARARRWRDKLEMKARIAEANIPCAEARAIDARTDAGELAGALGLPLVVKPRSGSGGRATHVVHSVPEVARVLADGAIAERFVPGAELSVESIVQRGEIRFENVTEYLEPRWANIVPAEIPAPLDRAVRDLNRAALTALEVEDGMTHLEVFVVDADPRREPEIVFGELACRPPGGALMELIETAYGFDPWQAYLEVELGRDVAPPREPRGSAGVWFLHPGEGRVVSLRGLSDARTVPGIARVDCTIEIGDDVARREGVGQHTGSIIAVTASRDATKQALEAARSAVQIEVDGAVDLSRDRASGHRRS